MSRLFMNYLLTNHHPATRSIINRALATNVSNNKASLDQLTILQDRLSTELPSFFRKYHPLDIYAKELVFIDNIRNVKTQGITQYMFVLQIIKFYYNVRYSSIRVELLNLVKNPEESYIKIRWRIITKPGLIKTAAFLFKPSQLEEWKDGISTLHVNKDGKIHCHICDNIETDIDRRGPEKSKSPLENRNLGVCNESTT